METPLESPRSHPQPQLTFTASTVTCASLELNGVSFLHSIQVHTSQTLRGGIIKLSLLDQRGNSAPLLVRSLEPISPNEPLSVDLSGVHLPSYLLRQSTERERVDIIASLTTPEGAPTTEARHPLSIIPASHWIGTESNPESIASFVTPNSPAIAQCLRDASSFIKVKTGDGALDGYQSKRADRVHFLAEACFKSLAARAIRYVSGQPSFETQGQKVRNASDVLSDGLGNCLDLSVTLAALMEACGLSPLIITGADHAIVGFHVQDNSDNSVLSGSSIINRLDLREIRLIEATSICDAATSFGDALDKGTKWCRSEYSNIIAVDIVASRRSGFHPLPDRLQNLDQAAQSPNRLPPETAWKVAQPSDLPTRPASTLAPHQLRLEKWRKRLLDLSMRNPLLKDSERNGCALLIEDESVISLLEDLLWEGRWLHLTPTHARQKLTTQAAIDELTRGTLRSPATASDLDQRAKKAYRSGKSSLEETGARSLFIAIGFLEYSADQLGQTVLAPLILVPVELEKVSRSEGFKLRGASDDPVPNVALIESLKTSQGVDLGIGSGRVSELDEDEKGLDIPAILERVRTAIKNLPKARVHAVAKLGIYAFRKLPLFEELREREHVLSEHPIVRSLLERQSVETLNKQSLVLPQQVENLCNFNQLHLPLPADSSQTAAVLSACHGATFVLQGPPGTGKSQTITNLIANSLALGKRVLFVAEKSAALSVVSHRLTKTGLTNFVLNLHADHATKANFVAQIQSALSALEEQPHSITNEFQRVTEDLEKNRIALKDATEALHTPTETGGESPHDAIENALKALDDAGETRFPTGSFDLAVKNCLHPTALTSYVEALDFIEESFRPIARIRHTIPDWLQPSNDAAPLPVKNDADTTKTLLVRALEKIKNLENHLEVTIPKSLSWFGAATRVINHLFQTTTNFPALIDVILADDFKARFHTLQQALNHHAEGNNAAAELSKHFHNEVLTLPLNDFLQTLRIARTQFFLLRFFSVRKVRVALSRFSKATPPTHLESLSSIIESLCASQEAIARAESAQPLLQSIVSHPELNPDNTLKETLHVCFQTASRLRQLFPDQLNHLSLRLSEKISAENLQQLVRECLDLVEKTSAAVQALESKICAENNLTEETLEVTALLSRLEAISEHSDNLPRIAKFQIAMKQAKTLGLDAFLAALELGQDQPEQIISAAKHELISAWVRARVNSDSALAKCLGETNVKARKTFSNALHKYWGRLPQSLAKTAAEKIRAEISRRDSQPMMKAAKHLHELRAVSTIRRPIRRVMREAGQAIAALKPIVLASPLSAATLLPTDFPTFDLVVFDEASQVPVWDAVCALSRAKSAVIVGDSKQLPPTTFFERKDSDESDAENHESFEVLESLLDEAIASGVNQLSLIWHYRSRDERLIEYSNRKSYAGRLKTFPSAHRTHPNLGVEFRFVGGTYARGQGSTNQAEAEAVIAELTLRLKSADACPANRSIGVVTFSLVQANLIQDLFDEALENDPTLVAVCSQIAEKGEPVFIKNLEGVQGDERATMLFSICFGKDANGTFHHNLGPLNLAGGERRLNVAVTRAQEKVIIFSSIRASDLDPAKCKSQGARDLRDYLAFAEHGTLPSTLETGTSHAAPELSSIETTLAQALETRGWIVDRHVGRSNDFRISLAVRNPTDPDQWSLGIELDGTFHKTAPTVIDRESVRDGVLATLGWKIIRICSLDVLYHLPKAIAQIESMLPKNK
jgi:hypothetical protein